MRVRNRKGAPDELAKALEALVEELVERKTDRRSQQHPVGFVQEVDEEQA